MLISLSGLDGAGKSTLIEPLRQLCEERGQPVVVRHMNDDIGVYAALRAIRDRMRGAQSAEDAERSLARHRGSEAAERGPNDCPAAGADRRARSVPGRIRDAIVWGKSLRRCLYPIDLVLFWAFRIYEERWKGRVVIMDRYFYDTIVDVADRGSGFWVAFLERLTPTPDLPIFLDVSPELSFARKGEYSVDYLRERWSAYQAIARRVPSSLHVANDDLAATRAMLRKVLARQLDARSRVRRGIRRLMPLRLPRSGR